MDIKQEQYQDMIMLDKMLKETEKNIKSMKEASRQYKKNIKDIKNVIRIFRELNKIDRQNYDSVIYTLECQLDIMKHERLKISEECLKTMDLAAAVKDMQNNLKNY